MIREHAVTQDPHPQHPSEPFRSARPPIWQLAVFSLAYFLSTWISRWLTPAATGWNVTLWVSSGLYLTVLTLSEPRHWPAWILAALPAALTGPPLFFDFPVIASIPAFAGDTLEALLGAWLLRRRSGGPFRLNSVNAVLLLVTLAAGLSPMISATVGALTVAGMEQGRFSAVWPLWWAGNAGGSLVAAAALLPLAEFRGERRTLSARYWQEATLLAALFAAATHVVFTTTLPLMFVLLLPVFWAAMRFELMGTTVTIPVLAAMATRYTAQGFGPFAHSGLSPEIQQAWAQIFLIVATLTTLLIGALTRQRRQALRTLTAANAFLESRVAARTAELQQSEQNQRRLAESLEVERARLDTILQHLPVGVWIANPGGRMVAKNPQADLIWAGDAPLAECGEDYAKYRAFDPATGDPLRWKEYPLAETLATGNPIDARVLNIRRFNGTEGVILNSAAPIRSPNGQPLGAVLISLDITERETMLRARRENESLLRGVIDSLPASIVVLDDAGVIRMANRVWDQYALENGSTAAEVSVGANYIEICRRAAAAGSRDAAKALEALETVRDGRESEAVIEYPCDLPDTSCWYVMHACRLRESGPGLVVTHLDITARKKAEIALHESEERFRLFMNHSPALAWIKDDASRYTYLNRAAEQHHGIMLADWLGKTDFDIWPAEIAAVLRQNDLAVLANDRPQEVTEETPNADGSVSTWISCKFPFRDAAGNRYVAGIGVDISEHKRVLEQLALVEFALNHVQESAYLIDEQGRFSYVNDTACLTRGYPRDQFLRMQIFDVDPDWSMDRWTAHWRDLQAAGSMLFEATHPAKDGAVIPVEITANYFEYTGRGYNLALVRDITERKRIEQERLAHVRFLERMDRINRALQGTSDLETMLTGTLDTLLSVLECDRAWLIYPCDPEAAEWQSVMERTHPQYPGAHALQLKLPVDEEVASVFEAVRAAPGPFKFGQENGQSVPSDLADRFQIRAQMAMALYPKIGQPWMFGIHQCAYSRVWTDEDAHLLEETGRRLTEALSILLAHRDLEASEARLAQAERIAHIGYWDLDQRTGQIALSDEACRIFGLPAGNRVFDLTEWRTRWAVLIHPDDREKTSQTAAEAWAGGPRFDMEYRVNLPGGEERFIHSVGDLTREGSDLPARWFGMIQDITERKQMEISLRRADEQRRQLMNQSRDGILILDQDYRVIEANAQQAAMLGYTVDELIGLYPWDFDAQWTEAEIRAGIAKQGAAGAIFETLHRRKDGSVYDAEVSCTSTVIEDQAVFLDVVRDITGRKREEAELRNAGKRKDEFLAMLAHELRNPLAPIRNACEVFKRFDLKEPELRWATQVIQRQVQHLARLVDDLLEASRVSRGKISLKMESLELPAVIERAIEAGLPLLEPKRQTLVVQRPFPVCRIEGDEVRLVQVLTNLLGNAAKYSDEGKRVWLYTELRDGEVEIRIKDEGIGISADLLPHVFELFTQAERSMDRSQGGLGIGLALVSRLIEMHGGRTSVTSGGDGKGSEFTVALRVM